MRGRAALGELAASVAEMAAPVNRRKLVYGIWSGYAIVLGFAILAVATSVFELTAWRWVYFVLVAIKLVTNSIAWLAIVRQRALLVTQGINTATDVLLLTAVIYFTGGPSSPLLATYVIATAVLSLLANLSVTILTAAFILVCFSTLMALMTAGVLPPQPVPGTPTMIAQNPIEVIAAPTDGTAPG